MRLRQVARRSSFTTCVGLIAAVSPSRMNAARRAWPVPKTIIGPPKPAVARVAVTSLGSMPPGVSSRVQARSQTSSAAAARARSSAAAA